MSRLSRNCLAVALAVLAGCDGSIPVDPPKGLSHALATPSCGPADGPIVAIYLAASPIESLQPPVPFLQVNIPTTLEELRAGQEWKVSELFTETTAWFYESAQMPIVANGGEVGITASSSTLIAGYVDLRFSNGSRIRGTFEARWQARQLLCG